MIPNHARPRASTRILCTIKYLTILGNFATIRPMSEQSEDTTPPSGAVKGDPRRLWATAAAVAGFGNLMLYDALPGINWVLWTAPAGAGPLLVFRPRGHSPPLVRL